jgi:hypothetical protein
MIRRVPFFVAFLALTGSTSAQVASPALRSPTTGSDYAHCAATAARRVQIMKETEQVVGKPVEGINSVASLVRRYFKVGCALSTVASTHDEFERAQAEYDEIVKAVAQRCKISTDCLSLYVQDLDTRLAQCAASAEAMNDLLRKLVPLAQDGCTIEFEP